MCIIEGQTKDKTKEKQEGSDCGGQRYPPTHITH